MNSLNSDNLIYKYVPYNSNSLKILINGELWFGKPKNQNDPFEGEFIIEGFIEKLSQKVKLILLKQVYPKHPFDSDKEELSDKEIISNYSDFIKKELKDIFGICCFSKDCEEILLWTHYSDSHKGMCLIFDKTKLSKSLKNEDSEVEGNIITDYSLKVPRIKVGISDNGYPFVNGYKLLLFKHKHFSYEKEFRYVKFF